MSLRVCFLDDSPLCIHGLRHVMAGAGHEVVGELIHPESLGSFLAQSQCDLVISEIRIDGLDLFDTCLEVIEQHSKIKLIVYTYDENPTHLARASALDAWDYIPKRYSIQRLVQSCESLATGLRPEDSLIASAKSFLTYNHLPPESLSVPLTKREYQILIHLSLGLSNRDISRSLKISLETVKEHVQNILRKLQTTDRTAAAIWSLRNGLPTLNVDPTL